MSWQVGRPQTKEEVKDDGDDDDNGEDGGDDDDEVRVEARCASSSAFPHIPINTPQLICNQILFYLIYYI